ncbi:MAG: glycosyltransferase 87 family protein [Segniliparus sp.]|uniref:glycosyltransferase 87 family protein n=1 Tax=Segniliparus sp. TaxID=2804064 RepID=UPI003F34B49E
MTGQTLRTGAARRLWAHRLRDVLLVLLACVAVTLFIQFALLESIRAGDFEVYRLAAERAFAGEDVYNVLFHGRWTPSQGIPFTYTPFAALFLWPTTWFSTPVAVTWWNVLAMASLAASLHCVWADARVRAPRPGGRPGLLWDGERWPKILACLVLLLAASNLVPYHLVRGQINLLLMGMCLLDVARRDDTWLGRWLPRGTLIGVAAAVKLTPFLFLVQFLVVRQWRLALWTAAGAAMATAAGFVAFPKMSWHFFTEKIWHLSGSVAYDPGMFASSGNGSVQGAVAFFGGPTWLGAGLAGLFCLFGLWCARAAFRSPGLLASTVVAGLTSTLVTPVSWIHHAVFLFPAVAMLLMDTGGAGRRIAAVLAVVLFVPGQTIADHLLAAHHWWLWPLALPLRFAQSAAEVGAVVLLAMPSVAGWTGDKTHPARRAVMV